MGNEIKLINSIVTEALISGGDAGGPYDSGNAELEDLLNEWISLKGLQDDYEVREEKVDAEITGVNNRHLCVTIKALQIVSNLF